MPSLHPRLHLPIIDRRYDSSLIVVSSQGQVNGTVRQEQ